MSKYDPNKCGHIWVGSGHWIYCLDCGVRELVLVSTRATLAFRDAPHETLSRVLTAVRDELAK